MPRTVITTNAVIGGSYVASAGDVGSDTPLYLVPIQGIFTTFNVNTDCTFDAASGYATPITFLTLDPADAWRLSAISINAGITVTSTGGDATAIMAAGFAPKVSNGGTITVHAAGRAVGIEIGALHLTGGFDQAFTNTQWALIDVNGGSSAFGVVLDTTAGLSNWGSITATAGSVDGAQAVAVTVTGGPLINMSVGQITAIDSDANHSIATGIAFHSNAGVSADQALIIANDGTITADRAIWEIADPSAVLTATSGQTLENRGVITGDIFLGMGRDTVWNSGVINGNLNLGSEDDLFHGMGRDGSDTGGEANGEVHGGGGNDLLEAGAGPEHLFGDTGNDTFVVGTGAAFMDGGDGIDTLDLAASTVGAVFDLSDTGAHSFGVDISATLTSVEGLSGSQFDDALSGDAAGNVLLGLDGADTLIGRAGDDLLLGGNGNDGLSADDGNDSLQGEAGDDTLSGGNGNDTVEGGTGNDTLTLGTGNDIILFKAVDGQDVVSDFDVAHDVIDLSRDEGFGAYTAVQQGADVVITLEGDDRITLSHVNLADLTSANFLLASSTPLHLDGDAKDDVLLGGAGADILNGGAGNNTLHGGSGDDVLTTGDGNDSLKGGYGDDLLVGGLGHNIIDGGGGTDTLSYENSNNAVFVFLNDHSATRFVNGNYQTDTLSNIENIIGTNANVTGEALFGDDNDNSIWALNGNDHAVGQGGNDHLYGGNGDDNLDGGTGDDYLTGDAGNDQMFGGDGIDTLDGGIGNDSLYGNGGADIMTGGLGDDIYYVGTGDGDVVTELADEGNDTVVLSGSGSLADFANFENISLGNAGHLTASGNSSNNVMHAGSISDTLIGGAGDDTYYIYAGDTIVEASGAGIDTVVIVASYTLADNVENLTLSDENLFFQDSNFTGTGNALDNHILGTRANNKLYGMDGNDVLDGGLGGDKMYGGNGNDTYYVDNAGDIVTELHGGGSDTVISSRAFTLGAEVEKLILTGSGNLAGTGNVLANTITGNNGNNKLSGGDGNDTLSGGFGNDTLDGGRGGDVLKGGQGDDRYYIDNKLDAVTEFGGQGTDTVLINGTYTLGLNVENLLLTGAGDRFATGNALDNHITGNRGNNTLGGADGNDIIDGGRGADSMRGGNGDDTFYVDNTGDTVTEYSGQGTDSVFSTISFTLGNNVENLTLSGVKNINATGNTRDNVLMGNSGHNVLTGGLGADMFVFAVGSGADTITDFSASEGDTLYLQPYHAQGTAMITQVGSDTVIDLGGGNVVTIANVTATDTTLLSHIVW